MLNIFGCNHQFTRVFTARGKEAPKAARLTGHYVCCTECGKQFPYDWENMKVLSPRDVRRIEGMAHRYLGRETA